MLDNQRREFIILAGAAGLLLAAKVNRARGQQPGMPVIGFLGSSSAKVSVKDLEAFRKGLSETGYLEGRNVAIEFRLDETNHGRLAAIVRTRPPPRFRPIQMCPKDLSSAP